MYRELTVPELILQKASEYLGLLEIAGEQDNPIILDMFEKIGHSWVKEDETSWCSCFVNFIANELDLTHSGKLNARSWLDVGEKSNRPIPGDIVVFWRESKDSWKGHIGIFVGYTAHGNILCLGGNQSNEVNITEYSKERLLDFRRLLKL